MNHTGRLGIREELAREMIRNIPPCRCPAMGCKGSRPLPLPASACIILEELARLTQRSATVWSGL